MKVLVTGGAGMIGFHAAKTYRAQGADVVVIDNLERSKLLGYNDKVSKERMAWNASILEKMGVDVRYLDISEPSSLDGLEGFDAIFHLAAQCGVPPSIEDPRRDFEVNTLGTLNVLEHARNYGGRVVYASTNKVYPLHDLFKLDKDNDRWVWAVDEWNNSGFPVEGGNGLVGSRTPYGNSKYMGDLLCQEYHHMYGVPTGVFRMSCIFGTNQFSFEEQGWITWFVIANQKGWPIDVFGDGYQVRDVLWVEDVIRAYGQFIAGPVDHGVWNLGGGTSPDHTYSLNEAISDIEDITGKDFVQVTYKNWRPSDQKVYTSNIDPLYEKFNWKPAIDRREGLERVFDWVKSNINIF